jgi:hypothetical protein
MSSFNVTVFQQPIGDRHTVYYIFTPFIITLLSLHHDKGEIAALCSGGTFQKAVGFNLSIKYTFSTNYKSELH